MESWLMLGQLNRVSEFVSKMLMVVAAIWAFVLAFYILVDVIARNLNMPIEGTSEIVTNSIVVVVFLQLAYCVHIRGMLRADFLLQLMGPRLTRILNIAGCLLCALFFACIVYGSYTGAWDAWVTGHFEGDGALRVPTWPARFAVLLGCALAAINYLLIAVTEIVEPPLAAAGPAI
jgi:TRAP-type C4-dicarboxylate transport system permease small subunit